jgi:hypothetical protein
MQQGLYQRWRCAFAARREIRGDRSLSSAPGWLTWPERAPGAAIALVGAVFLVAYTASLVWLPKPDGRIVVGDAVEYFVYLRSAVFDRDLDFRNEYARFFGARPASAPPGWRIYDRTPTGHAPNFMSVGPALAWAPLYLATASGVAIADGVGAHYPLDGYGRLFQASAGISGVLAAAVGAWLAFLWANRLFGTRAAVWATLAVWLGSSTIYYSVISPTYSHAVSMLTSALFFYVWGTTLDRQTPSRYALVGLLGGLNALVRWQDVVFLIAPVLDAGWALSLERPLDWRRLWRATGRVAVCLGVAFVAFLPQLLAWTAIYGSPFLVPQGEGFMRWTSPRLFQVLFSDLHGLISWTPIVALALGGCVFLPRANRVVAAAVIAILAVEWYTNAAVADWWGGEAYGARRFIGCFPLFVLGLAALYERIDRRRSRDANLAAAVEDRRVRPPRLRAFRFRPPGALTVTLVFVGFNLLLLVQYQAFLKGFRDIVPYPHGFYGLWLARFVTPFSLAKKLWHAFP